MIIDKTPPPFIFPLEENTEFLCKKCNGFGYYFSDRSREIKKLTNCEVCGGNGTVTWIEDLFSNYVESK